MLGRDVVAAAGDAGHEAVALARADLDITNAAAVNAAVQDARPDAIINCAAWTDVDGAETAEAQATAVNGTGPGLLAQAAGVRCSCTCRATTCSTAPRPSRTARTRRPARRARTGGPSSPASTRSPRPAAAARSCAPRGCSARTERTSWTPCGAWAPSERRSPWSTTRSAAPPTRGTWHPRWSRSPSAASPASCTSPAAAAARGSTSRTRRSRRPA